MFDDRLSASLSQIQKAQESMERLVKQDIAQLHVDLLQEFNNVSEDFAKRCGMLLDIQTRMHMKIKQVAGLRDGVGSLTDPGIRVQPLTKTRYPPLPMWRIVKPQSAKATIFASSPMSLSPISLCPLSPVFSLSLMLRLWTQPTT